MISYSFFITNSSFLTSLCVHVARPLLCWVLLGEGVTRNDSINKHDLVDTHTEKLLPESNLANFMDGINFWDQKMCFGARSE